MKGETMKQKTSLVIFIVFSLLLTSALAATSSESNNPVGSAVLVSMLNQDPDPAAAGDIVEIRIGVQNLGDEATKEYYLELSPQYPFEAIDGESLVSNLGILSPTLTGDNMKIVKFKVKIDKDATAGSYDLPVLSYEKGDRDVNAKNLFSIDIESKESAEIIVIDKTVLIPGNEDNLTFTIKNVGSAPLRDLTFSWENSDDILLPVGSDNTKYIKYIDVGESAEVQYKVIADTNADAGLYKLDLKLTYEDSVSGTLKEVSTSAGIYVGGGTDFDVAYSESSGSDMSFTVANIGSNPAFSVSVIVPQQDSWSTTGSNSMIIGNLNTGDYTVVTFALKQSSQSGIPSVANTNNGNINIQNRSAQRIMPAQTNGKLKVQVAYTDTMGKRKTVDKEVEMNQESSTTNTTTSNIGSQYPGYGQFGRRTTQQSFFTKYKTYLIVLVVLIILTTVIVLRVRYKRQKLLNPNFKFKDLFRKKKK
jgi:hypothetical protein